MFIGLESDAVPVISAGGETTAWRFTAVGAHRLEYFFIATFSVVTPNEQRVRGTQLMATVDGLLDLVSQAAELCDLRLVISSCNSVRGIMTVEEVRRLAVTQTSETAEAPVHGAWVETRSGAEYALGINDLWEAKARCKNFIIDSKSELCINPYENA